MKLSTATRIGLSTVFLAATVAQADVLTVASYDMNNGHGQASSGSFNYWDRAYSGAGSTITDNALLSGGKGDLTDGLITAGNWYDVENSAGTGPYVGWRSSVLPAGPEITFHFASSVSISAIRIHADDSAGVGGVSLPSSVSFNGGTPILVTDPDAGSAPSWLEFAGLSLSGNSVQVKFGYGNEWVFVDEVQFIGSVPEPETYAMMLAGLGLLAVAARTKSRT